MDCKVHWILDNGHGEDTPGKRSPVWENGEQLLEYEFTRYIVNNLSKKLDGEGIDNTILVPEMVDVSLEERVARANKIFESTDKDCVLISVHGNYYKKESIHGVETFYYDGSEDGYMVADLLQSYLVLFTNWHDRGVKPNTSFYILKNTKMPAILSENGFYSNYKQCMQMLSNEYRDKIILAHLDTIKEIEED